MLFRSTIHPPVGHPVVIQWRRGQPLQFATNPDLRTLPARGPAKVQREGALLGGANFFWPRPATNSPSTANQRPIKEPLAVPLARVGVLPRAAAAGGGRSRNSSPLCRGTRGAADPGISPRLRRRVGIPGRQLNPPPGTSAGCRRPPPSARGPTPGLWSARALGLRAAGQRLGGWRHARPCV